MSKYKLTPEETIPYNYRLYTGVIMSDHAVDQYNRLQQEVKAYQVENIPVPGWLLDAKHQVLTFEAEKNI